jgi:hypothetical protein
MTPIGLKYEVVERLGRHRLEVSLDKPGESVVIASREVNPDFAFGGAEGAAWGIVVECLAKVFEESP